MNILGSQERGSRSKSDNREMESESERKRVNERNTVDG